MNNPIVQMTQSVARVCELRDAHGSIMKRSILDRYRDDPNFCSLLHYILNPTITYKLSSETRLPVDFRQPRVYFPDIFALCDYLAGKKALSGADLDCVASFLHGVADQGERNFYLSLLTRTLKLGVTAKTVNRVIPGLIPEWEVQQAYPIEKYPLADGTWFSLTQKLNGVRATYYDGQLFARSGVPYTGLDHILDEIRKIGRDDFVLDGELILADKSGYSDNEAFRIATGLLNSENADKTSICYTVFDALKRDEFEKDAGEAPYRTRRSFLEVITANLRPDSPVRVLPVLYSGKDQSMIWKLLDQMVREDKEGLMVNTDVPYKRRRHNGILKVKRFYTMDLPILQCEEGSGRLAGTLGAFVLDYKGNEVRVGSGFSDEQRSTFWEGRDDLIGTLCEVKYKEISSDKNTGAESLQFPVFVTLRTDKDTVSYG